MTLAEARESDAESHVHAGDYHTLSYTTTVEQREMPWVAAEIR